MKLIFNFFMSIQVGLYRLTGGKLMGNMLGFKVLLLTTTGRKSGKTRTVPLGYFARQGGYAIVASNGGADTHPGWYFNLKNQPQASVQIGNKILNVNVQVLSGEARAQAWQQVITEAPRYARYEKSTKREIPVVLLTPR